MFNLEIFHKFDFFPREVFLMKIAFISLITSSNDVSRSKMLNLSIRLQDNGNLTEFETFIKPVPPLSPTDKSRLSFRYELLRQAPPLCDIAFRIIEIIENAITVFLDKFSERVFKSSFREIGYPMGSASCILETTFKRVLKSKIAFTLNEALAVLKISEAPSNSQAMEMIYNKLQDVASLSDFAAKLIPKDNSVLSDPDFTNLPNRTGVYLFRDGAGKVIYVGKAKNILQRVRSHFTSKLSFEKELCAKVRDIDFEETGSETIALLLESHYITTLKPENNTQQIDVIDPYIIASKIDSKGILRIQILQKSYVDSENEFYYNRDSVLKTVLEVQQKFNLCRRFTGIERSRGKCSDTIFCKGICEGLEEEETYNIRVKNALYYIDQKRPSYFIKLKGRSVFETGLILVEDGIYQGYGFIDLETPVNSIEDIESFITRYSHNYFTSRIIDQYKEVPRFSENIIRFQS